MKVISPDFMPTMAKKAVFRQKSAFFHLTLFFMQITFSGIVAVASTLSIKKVDFSHDKPQ